MDEYRAEMLTYFLLLCIIIMHWHLTWASENIRLLFFVQYLRSSVMGVRGNQIASYSMRTETYSVKEGQPPPL